MNSRRIKLPALLVLLALAGAAISAERWMTIFTAKGGYQFKGMVKGDAWAFVVPGGTIRTADDNGRMFADVDKVIVQAMTMRRTDFPTQDALASYRKYETEYLKGLGATITDSGICGSMTIPHQEWRAAGVPRAPGTTSTYIAVVTKASILIIIVAYDKNASVMSADSKLRGICASLEI